MQLQTIKTIAFAQPVDNFDAIKARTGAHFAHFCNCV